VEGRKLFGSRPGEEKVITRMTELRAQGLNYPAIAQALNTEGLRPQSGGSWFPASVSRTLARE
jgi:hypothetical protein